MSPKEEALWLFQQINPDAPVVVPVAFRVHRALRWWPLHEAVRHMVSRHPALRTVFPEVDGAPVRRVLDPDDEQAAVEIEVIATDPLTLETDLGEFVRRPFDVTDEILVRVGHFTGDPAGDVLCLVVHHLVFDAASAGLFLEGVVELYDCLDRGEGIPERLVGEVPRFIESAPAEDDLRYWREHLDGAGSASLDLAQDSAVPTTPYAGRQVVRPLPKGAVDTLARFAKEASATPNIVLMSLFYLLLSCHGAGDDVVVITPLDIRTPAGRDSVGYHVNICGVRARWKARTTFRDLVRQTRETFLNGVLHARTSLDEIAPGSYDSSSEWRNPLSRYMFDFSPFSSDWTSRYDIDILPVQTGFSRLDLTLCVIPRADGMLLQLIHRVGLFSREAVDALLDRYVALLYACTAEPDRPVGELSPWSDSDRETVAAALVPSAGAEASVLAPVLQQAQEAGDRVALRQSGNTTTYRSLTAEAEALAHRLSEEGVGRGDTVGLWAAPGVEAAASILAVWRVGAILVPLPRTGDPAGLAELCGQLDVRTLIGVDVPGELSTGRRVLPAATGTAEIPSPQPWHTADSDDVAVFWPSPGTSPQASAACLTHGRLASLVAAAAESLGGDPADTVLWTDDGMPLAALLRLLVPLTRGGAAQVALSDTVAQPELTPSTAVAPWLLDVAHPSSSTPSTQVALLEGRQTTGDPEGEPTPRTLAVMMLPADRAGVLGRPLPGPGTAVLDGHGRELPPGLSGRLRLGQRHTDLTAHWRWDGLLERTQQSARPITRPPQTHTDLDTVSTGETEADELVAVLVTIWRELLDQPQLDGQSHFFTNGGTSVLAGRLVARIKKETGLRIPLKQVFAAPTPERLAAFARDREKSGPAGSQR